jgi:hypothetical protein
LRTGQQEVESYSRSFQQSRQVIESSAEKITANKGVVER